MSATSRYDGGSALYTKADQFGSLLRFPSDDRKSYETFPSNTDGSYQTVVADFNLFGPPGTYQVAFVSARVYVPGWTGGVMRVLCNLSALSREGSQQTSTIFEKYVEPDPLGADVYQLVSDGPLLWQSVTGGNVQPVVVEFVNNQGTVLNTHPSSAAGPPPSSLTVMLRRSAPIS